MVPHGLTELKGGILEEALEAHHPQPYIDLRMNGLCSSVIECVDYLARYLHFVFSRSEPD